MNFIISNFIKLKKKYLLYKRIAFLISIIIFLVSLMLSIRINSDFCILLITTLGFICWIFFEILSLKREICVLIKSKPFIEKKEYKRELKHIVSYNNKGLYILTDNFIFMLESRLAIRYTDIVLLYNYYVFHGRSTSLSYYQLCAITANNKKLYLGRYKKFGLDLSSTEMNFIMNKNPNVLVGKTKENKKILLEKYGINL